MKKSLLYLTMFLLLTSKVRSQTTNGGLLYVSEATQFSTIERFNNLPAAEFYNDGESFIYHHFNNDGIVDFYQETGSTLFVGNSIQKIGGSHTSYVHHVLFDNNSGLSPFQLSGELDVNGTVDFYQGIVDADNFEGRINFTQTGEHINTSDVSYVDGFVNKMGSTAFIFPIGDGGFYRQSGISSPSTANSYYKSKFYLENSNSMYSHELKSEVIFEINDKEYWKIEKESTLNEDILITLSWRDVTTPQAMINAAMTNTLIIVRWDEQKNIWVNEGGVINLDNQTVTTTVSDFGVFTFGRINEDIVLPCGLVIYNAITPNDNGINDFLLIDQDNNGCASNLHVQIFNRWGVRVFESHNYGVSGEVFRGFSNGRGTISGSNLLPSGTYYYIVNYEYNGGESIKKHKQAGYLYLNGN